MRIIQKSTNPIMEISYSEMAANNGELASSVFNGLEEVLEVLASFHAAKSFGKIHLYIADGEITMVEATENIKIK